MWFPLMLFLSAAAAFVIVMIEGLPGGDTNDERTERTKPDK